VAEDLLPVLDLCDECAAKTEGKLFFGSGRWTRESIITTLDRAREMFGNPPTRSEIAMHIRGSRTEAPLRYRLIVDGATDD